MSDDETVTVDIWVLEELLKVFAGHHLSELPSDLEEAVRTATDVVEQAKREASQ